MVLINHCDPADDNSLLLLSDNVNMKCAAPFVLILILLPLLTDAGLLAYGICQTGCNACVVACYAAAGFTFGTVTAGAAVPAALIACNAAQGVCMAACVAAGLSPTP